MTQEDAEPNPDLRPLSSDSGGSEAASNSSSRSYDTQMKELQQRKKPAAAEKVEDVTCDEIQQEMEARGENITVLLGGSETIPAETLPDAHILEETLAEESLA